MNAKLVKKQLELYQEHAAGKISTEYLNNEIYALEKAAELDVKEVKSFFKKIEDACPDLKDDLKDLFEKIEESCEDGDGDGDDGDDKGDEVVEESTSYEDLLNILGM